MARALREDDLTTSDQQRLDVLFPILQTICVEAYLPSSKANGIARRYLEVQCMSEWSGLPFSLQASCESFWRENVTHSNGLKRSYKAHESTADYVQRVFDDVLIDRQALGDIIFRKLSDSRTSLRDQLRVCLLMGLGGRIKRLYIRAQAIIKEISAANARAARRETYYRNQAITLYKQASFSDKINLRALARDVRMRAKFLIDQADAARSAADHYAIGFAKEFIMHRIESDIFMPPKEHERLLRFLKNVLKVPADELPPVWKSDERGVVVADQESWLAQVKKRAQVYWPDATIEEMEDEHQLIDGKQTHVSDAVVEPSPSFSYRHTTDASKFPKTIPFDPSNRFRVQLQIEQSHPDSRKSVMHAMPSTRDVVMDDACATGKAYWGNVLAIHQQETGRYRHTHVPFDVVSFVRRLRGKVPGYFEGAAAGTQPETLAADIVKYFFVPHFESEGKVRNSSQEHVAIVTALHSMGLLSVEAGKLGCARRGLLHPRRIFNEPETEQEFGRHFCGKVLQKLTANMKKCGAGQVGYTRYNYNISALRKLLATMAGDRLSRQARDGGNANYLGVSSSAELLVLIEKLEEFGVGRANLYVVLSYVTSEQLQALMTEEFAQRYPALWAEAFLIRLDRKHNIEDLQAMATGTVTSPNPGKAFAQRFNLSLSLEDIEEIEERIEHHFHEYKQALASCKAVLDDRYDVHSRRLLRQLGGDFLPSNIRKNLKSYRKIIKAGQRHQAATSLFDQVNVVKFSQLFKLVFHNGAGEHVLAKFRENPKETEAALLRVESLSERKELAARWLEMSGMVADCVRVAEPNHVLLCNAFEFNGGSERGAHLAGFAYQVAESLLDAGERNVGDELDAESDSVSSDGSETQLFSQPNRAMIVSIGRLAVRTVGHGLCGFILFLLYLRCVNERTALKHFKGALDDFRPTHSHTPSSISRVSSQSMLVSGESFDTGDNSDSSNRAEIPVTPTKRGERRNRSDSLYNRLAKSDEGKRHMVSSPDVIVCN